MNGLFLTCHVLSEAAFLFEHFLFQVSNLSSADVTKTDKLYKMHYMLFQDEYIYMFLIWEENDQKRNRTKLT